MQKCNEKPISFLNGVVLFTLIYGLSFVVDSFFATRTGIDVQLVKFITTSIFLVISVAIGKHIGLSIGIGDLPWEKIIFPIMLFSLLILAVGITGSVVKHGNATDLSRLCAAAPVSLLNLARTGFVSPGLETILFASILPTLYIWRYKSSNPVMGVIVTSILFALLHFRGSVEAFLATLSAGILFCYMSFALKSLLGTFILHSVTNLTLLALDSLGVNFCTAVHRMNTGVAMTVFCVGLALSFLTLVPLGKATSYE